MKFFKHIGPATFITAAFIGPGTVSTCALAGIHYGYSLIWVMIISLIMTLFLQELVARLAILYQKDLTELVVINFRGKRILKIGMISLIFLAIVIGNTAYEAGNISGVNIGLQILGYDDFFISLYDIKINYAVLIIAGLAFFILNLRSHKSIEKSLMLLVGILSLSFLILAFVTTKSSIAVIKGIFSPGLFNTDFLLIAALIGTTVVPYNLFLHSALAREKWKNSEGIKSMRIDTAIAVSLGILVSISIIITTANIADSLASVNNLGVALEPVLGKFSSYLMGIGFVSAGLTSAITAPLAAAFVINKLFKLNYSTTSFAFKRLSYAILTIGGVIAAFDFNPVEVIKSAQVANAIILPLIVFIIIWISQSKPDKIKFYRPSLILGIILFMLSVVLSFISIAKVFDFVD